MSDVIQLQLFEFRGRLYAHGETRLTWREIAQADQTCPITPISTQRVTPYPSRQRHRGWGGETAPRKFTSKQARLLREGGAVLEYLGRKNTRFVTLTLPGSTFEALDALERHNAEAANAFNQYLRRHLGTGTALYEYCWEYQQRGALHLHYAIYVPENLEHKFSQEAIRKVWRQILINISRKSGVDLFAIAGGGTWRFVPYFPRVDVQACRKSVGAYLAKYTSKKAREKANSKQSGPAKWSNVSRALRELAAQRRQTVSVVVASKEEARALISAAAKQLRFDATARVVHPLSKEDIGRVFWTKFELAQSEFRKVETLVEEKKRERKRIGTRQTRHGQGVAGIPCPVGVERRKDSDHNRRHSEGFEARGNLDEPRRKRFVGLQSSLIRAHRRQSAADCAANVSRASASNYWSRRLEG